MSIYKVYVRLVFFFPAFTFVILVLYGENTINYGENTIIAIIANIRDIYHIFYLLCGSKISNTSWVHIFKNSSHEMLQMFFLLTVSRDLKDVAKYYF